MCRSGWPTAPVKKEPLKLGPVAVENKWCPCRVAGGAPFDLSSSFLLPLSRGPKLPMGVWSSFDRRFWMALIFQTPECESIAEKGQRWKADLGGSKVPTWKYRFALFLRRTLVWGQSSRWTWKRLRQMLACTKRIQWASTRPFKHLQNIYILCIRLILLSRSASIEGSQKMSLNSQIADITS